MKLASCACLLAIADASLKAHPDVISHEQFRTCASIGRRDRLGNWRYCCLEMEAGGRIWIRSHSASHCAAPWWPVSTCANGSPCSRTRRRAASLRGPIWRISGASCSSSTTCRRAPRFSSATPRGRRSLASRSPGAAREFAGALTLSFCADLDLRRPLCPGGSLRATPIPSGAHLLPGGALPARWIALHGIQDQVCPVGPARAFAQAVPGARFRPLPGVGHSYRGYAALVGSLPRLIRGAGWHFRPLISLDPRLAT